MASQRVRVRSNVTGFQALRVTAYGSLPLEQISICVEIMDFIDLRKEMSPSDAVHTALLDPARVSGESFILDDLGCQLHV